MLASPSFPPRDSFSSARVGWTCADGKRFVNSGGHYGPGVERAQGMRVIRDAHERGVTFFDTAEV